MMAVQTIKESVFAEDFHKLIAGSNEPAELQKLRCEAFEIFETNGFPTPRLEDWKYTNVASVVGDQWSVAGKTTRSSSDLPIELLGKFKFERNGFAALNLAFAEISVIRIPKETSVEEPFEISFGGEEGVVSFPHVIVIAEAGSKATLIETYASDAKSFTNAAVQIVVEENANLTHYRVQKDTAEAVHYGVTEISVGRGG